MHYSVFSVFDGQRICSKKDIDRLRFSTKCWFKGINDGIDPAAMPFLSLFIERKTLVGLGYVSNMDTLDCYTASCLINIEAEIKKQESEERKREASKARGKRGR